jgi:cyclic-di-GMP phosphodiesterase TipF (flagellum assembly factor)
MMRRPKIAGKDAQGLMSAIANISLIILYALGAIALGWAVHAREAATGGEAAVLGMLVFVLLMVCHEIVQRRRTETRTLHRILLLKRAHDGLRQDLSNSRYETQCLFELVEERAGPDVLEAIRSAAEEAGGETGAEDRPRLARARHSAGPEMPPPRSEPDPGGVEAEVRVLHQLVEQLYSDDAPPVLRSREGGDEWANSERPGDESESQSTRREPKLGRPPPADKGLERNRPGLRVVADEGPNARPSPKNDAAHLSEERVLEIVRDGLREDRVDLYLQPIVSLPQRKRRFFECSSRIRAADGTEVSAAQYLDPARRAGLSTAVDNMLLFRCVQLLRKVRRRDATTAFFCNISAHTLADREFFRDFIAYMENHRELASSLVLEMAQSDFDAQRTRLGPDLKRIADMGYRFSLDAVDRLDLDLGEMEALNIHFLKIDAGLILETLESGGEAASQLRMLKQQLDAHDIDLIVERIETERMLVELLEFNIDFGQGYLFGDPKMSRDPGEGTAHKGAK